MSGNVLIIGASGDIGISIAKKLAAHGCQLLLHYHTNRKALNDLISELELEQVLQVIGADLTKEEGISSLFGAIAYDVDTIIFANGKASMGLFQELSNGTLTEMMMLHMKSPLMLTNKLLPGMLRRQRGKIVFITSIWGEVGASNEVLYSTLKGAQHSFVQSLAKETAGSGVTVHAVSPGFIDTKMNADLPEEDKSAIFEEIPLKRAGTPDEVAEAVAFLLTSRSDYLSGQIIRVSGGWMI